MRSIWGFYLSFSGILTFQNATMLREIAKTVPADRLLIETDCPYLTPIPHRGKRNEPAYVKHVAELLATIKSNDTVLTVEDMAPHHQRERATTLQNSLSCCFRLRCALGSLRGFPPLSLDRFTRPASPPSSSLKAMTGTLEDHSCNLARNSGAPDDECPGRSGRVRHFMIRRHHGAISAIAASQPLNHLVGPFASLRIDDFDAGLEFMVLRARAALPPIEDQGDRMPLPLTITGQALQ